MATKTETPATQAAVSALSDQGISDGYIYLLGRLTVTRQQQLDFQEEFKWNELLHRKPGAVDWPNPNLDVAYSEAWVAVDENSYLLVSVPQITDRYYTVQFLNGWGETLANINARTFPDQPYGDFAVCLKGVERDRSSGCAPRRSASEIFARPAPRRAWRGLGKGHRAAASVLVQGGGL